MGEMIDVVFPNYNKQPFIRECLNSLLAQTYTNWRCIVVDNCSDDGSWEIIQEVARQDNRFELYQRPKPRIFYETWNFGLSKIKNSYFCILTSDDVWDKNWLQIAIKSLANHKTAVCAAARTKLIDADSQCGQTALFNSAGEKFFMTDGATPELRNGMVSTIASYFIGPIYTSIHSLLMRSEILNQGEKFAEDVGSTADYEWYIRLGLYGDIVYHPEIEVGWRIYEGQATKRRDQLSYGKFLQQIHLRTREEIAKKLDGLAGDFIAMAEDYDNRVLAYHYARPYLVNLRDKPLVEIPRLLKVLSTRPKEFFMDCLFQIKGQYYFVEESLATAKRFYGKITEATK